MEQGQQKVYRRVVWGIVLLMPFVSAFALSSWLPLPLLFVMLAFVGLFFGRRFGLVFFKSDLLLVGVYVLSLVAAFIAAPHIGERTLNHTFAFGVSVFFYFFVIRSVLLHIDVQPLIGRVFAAMITLLSFFVVAEFVLSNAYGIDFDAFIPHYRQDITVESGAMVFGIFVRPRGLAEEAGHTSLLYELGLPIASLYIRHLSWLKRVGFYTLTISAFLMLFSAAGLVALILALAFVGFLKLKARYLRHLLTGLALVAGLLIWQPTIVKPAFETIQRKARVFDETPTGSGSASVRHQTYEESLQIAQYAPQGLGWGTLYQIRQDRQSIAGVMLETGTLSLYLEVLLASGFLGLVFFLLFIGGKVIYLLRLNTEAAHAVLVALVSLGLHYLFISNFWFPMPWFALGLADVLWVQESSYRTPKILLKSRFAQRLS